MNIDAISSSSYRGMQIAIERYDRRADEVAKGDLDVGNAVDRIEQERQFEANAAAMRAEDEMIGSLLDALA